MIEVVNGNLLEAPVEALVNPVNCVGVMGKGLALAFAKRYPEVDRAYVADCRAGRFSPGAVRAYPTDALVGPSTVICVATKDHWRHPSKLEWIRSGLASLGVLLEVEGIASVAIPALGCGLGGLSWPVVRDQVTLKLGSHPCSIRLYAPAR